MLVEIPYLSATKDLLGLICYRVPLPGNWKRSFYYGRPNHPDDRHLITLGDVLAFLDYSGTFGGDTEWGGDSINRGEFAGLPSVLSSSFYSWVTS